MGFPAQMIAVAVGWQVYAIRRNPLDLGLIGLAEFVPLPVLALHAGQFADRVSRRAIVVAALALDIAVAGALLGVTLAGARQLWPFLALAATTGVSGAFGSPALRALATELVPLELLPSATALRSVAGQTAVVTGPAVGGVLFAVRPELVYAVAAALFGVALLSVLAVRRPGVVERLGGEAAPGFAALVAGVRFVLRTRILLGAIALDLFAVLFGGAVALLPVFARSILHTGPVGLGVLRSATAVGALVAGVMLARRPLGGAAGRTLLVVVAVFGASMVVFGLSRSIALSLAALAVG